MQVVHASVKARHTINGPILSEDERKEIFINIGGIYALNYDLLRELKVQLKNWLVCSYINIINVSYNVQNTSYMPCLTKYDISHTS